MPTKSKSSENNWYQGDDMGSNEAEFFKYCFEVIFI